MLKVGDRLEKKTDGHQEEKLTGTRLGRREEGKKGRAHFSGHVSVEDWPRKCHFQPPVSRKTLTRNVSWVVPDNLGILIPPLFLSVLWSKVTASISIPFSSTHER